MVLFSQLKVKDDIRSAFIELIPLFNCNNNGTKF